MQTALKRKTNQSDIPDYALEETENEQSFKKAYLEEIISFTNTSIENRVNFV